MLSVTCIGLWLDAFWSCLSFCSCGNHTPSTQSGVDAGGRPICSSMLSTTETLCSCTSRHATTERRLVQTSSTITTPQAVLTGRGLPSHCCNTLNQLSMNSLLLVLPRSPVTHMHSQRLQVVRTAPDALKEVCSAAQTWCWAWRVLARSSCMVIEAAGMQGSHGLAQVAGREGRQRPQL